jgi:hypothetical protein
MYKVTDGTKAMKAKHHDGATEFPVWRALEELGVGITDRLTVRGQFGYTHDGDIDRKGMHVGRLGLDYRVFDGNATDGWVWDVYADAHLGGISKMTGTYTVLINGVNDNRSTGFSYDNYSNGRGGFYAGTQFGKTWGKFSGAVFAEILQTFGNDNNEIDVTSTKADANTAITSSALTSLSGAISACAGGNQQACKLAGLAMLSDNLSVNLKSTLEYNVGIKGFYELSSDWSLGGAFTYKHHADNGIKSVATTQNNSLSITVADALAAQMKSMDDGFDEYIVSASIANKLSETVQIALYGEYTFDTAHKMSQNGTDVKAELGVRLNARF